MFPPIFVIAAAAQPVKDAFGENPVRFFPFGEAPPGVGLPYAVWQTVYGGPDNVLSGTPDIDSFGVQVDVYGDTADSVRTAAKALRDALEPHAYITRWGGEGRDPETKNRRFSFDVELIEERSDES